ncbi:deoxyribose-phosphate aldolase [Bacillus hwajinpoensis]|uniref:Deoxyribose-phosphate aldolase n=1 Tax=Guptibacillus hwajinpoensis TaxID=208199 RepID=A0A845F0B2_9BACL|nr:deoxyribose-phosphate aldolase [Pseudalkalibacillus hwajinpoensis]
MEMSSYIDHTLLDPEATKEAVEALCKEAITYGFATVCVHPYWVPFAKEILETSSVGITSVIGFPLGMTTKKVKAMETLDCIEKGATEIDMVINIGALKSKQYEEVEDDIREVVEAAKGKTVKVIIETGTLTEEEKVKACELSMSAGATFVKTSTGFGKGQGTSK